MYIHNGAEKRRLAQYKYFVGCFSRDGEKFALGDFRNQLNARFPICNGEFAHLPVYKLHKSSCDNRTMGTDDRHFVSLWCLNFSHRIPKTRTRVYGRCGDLFKVGVRIFSCRITPWQRIVFRVLDFMWNEEFVISPSSEKVIVQSETLKRSVGCRVPCTGGVVLLVRENTLSRWIIDKSIGIYSC